MLSPTTVSLLLSSARLAARLAREFPELSPQEILKRLRSGKGLGLVATTSATPIALGFGAGVALGTGLGVLLAPGAGAETRRKLKQQLSSLSLKISEKLKPEATSAEATEASEPATESAANESEHKAKPDFSN